MERRRDYPLWSDAVEPTMCTLHYGQTVFEGLKAFHCKNGGANVFRPIMNARRLVMSSEKVSIPHTIRKNA